MREFRTGEGRRRRNIDYRPYVFLNCIVFCQLDGRRKIDSDIFGGLCLYAGAVNQYFDLTEIRPVGIADIVDHVFIVFRTQIGRKKIHADDPVTLF